MKTLLLLRHAKSSWNDPLLSDHDRPLNKRGRKAAPRMGRLLRDQGLRPELILCSTATRAQETAKLLLDKLREPVPQTTLPELYLCEAARFPMLLSQVAEPIQSVLVVGHNPGLEEFLSKLVNESHELPTATLAQVEIDLTEWSQFGTGTRGRLIQIWRPRELNED